MSGFMSLGIIAKLLSKRVVSDDLQFGRGGSPNVHTARPSPLTKGMILGIRRAGAWEQPQVGAGEGGHREAVRGEPIPPPVSVLSGRAGFLDFGLPLLLSLFPCHSPAPISCAPLRAPAAGCAEPGHHEMGETHACGFMSSLSSVALLTPR